MPTPKHFCADCGGKMVFDSNLTIKSKSVSGWWCLKCDIVEVCFKSKVHNAVTSAKRFLFYGKLGNND